MEQKGISVGLGVITEISHTDSSNQMLDFIVGFLGLRVFFAVLNVTCVVTLPHCFLASQVRLFRRF